MRAVKLLMLLIGMLLAVPANLDCRVHAFRRVLALTVSAVCSARLPRADDNVCAVTSVALDKLYI